jgi:hypothetical protein
VNRLATDPGLLLVLLAGAALRVYLAATVPYIHDEENSTIPLSRQISFDAGSLDLPLRAVNHPALPAYIVKVSATLGGTTPLGYRAAHVVLGLCAVLLLYLLTREVCGVRAARWAAALLAFNDYFVTVSSRATAHGPYLLFVVATLWSFNRGLTTGRAVWLYAAGIAVALAFYCKEHAVLLLPALWLTLLLPRNRHWLRGPHPYLACVVFAILIMPDVVWNLRADLQRDRAASGDSVMPQATYASHLKRIGGIGFSIYPFVFYARAPVVAIYQRVTDGRFDDNTPEYQSMNPALGLLLLAAVVVTTIRARVEGKTRGLLLLAFWCTFGFFTLIRRGESPGLDPVSWIWVDATMLSAAALAGARVADATGKWRPALWAWAGLGVAYAIVRVLD